MTPDETLDHALDQLEGHALEAAELALAANAILAAKSSRLRLALDLLLDDGLDDLKVPANLAQMTARAVSDLSRTKPVAKRAKRFSDYLPATVGFRWADVAVAATILIAGVATLIPAIQRSHDRMNQAGCTFNLHSLGTDLLRYRDQNGSYPYIPPESPGSHAGSYALLLHDAGFLDDPARLHCPCFTHSENVQHPPLPDFEAACRIKAENPERFQRVIGGDYAYQVGLRKAGSPFMNVGLQVSSTTPLLADQPPNDGRKTILEGNSPNHRSMGQNVLYGDGHTQWHPTRRLGPRDADMFLNQHARPAPGNALDDSVMVPPPFPFHGP